MAEIKFVDKARGVEAELATFNKRMFDLSAACDDGDGSWENIEARYAFVQAALHAEENPEAKAYIDERIGSDELDEADIPELISLYIEVNACYKQPVQDTQEKVDEPTMNRADRRASFKRLR